MHHALICAAALVSLTALSSCGGRTDGDAATAGSQGTNSQSTNTDAGALFLNDASGLGVAPNGTTIDIDMFTRDPDEESGLQVFKPRLIRAKVGDTLRFIPTDETHQSSSIPGMIPDGLEGWAGELNQEVAYVLPKPGIYGYQCVPHYAAGMIGLIVVEGEGMSDNLEAARAVTHPGLAAREFAEIFDQADAAGMLGG